MKTFISLLSILLLSVIAIAQVNPRNTYVRPHYRSNGTFVRGHYRTVPNRTINDNYSTFPNVNPYTGKQGTIMPESNTPSTYRRQPSPSAYPNYQQPPSYPTYSEPPNYSSYSSPISSSELSPNNTLYSTSSSSSIVAAPFRNSVVENYSKQETEEWIKTTFMKFQIPTGLCSPSHAGEHTCAQEIPHMIYFKGGYFIYEYLDGNFKRKQMKIPLFDISGIRGNSNTITFWMGSNSIVDTNLETNIATTTFRRTIGFNCGAESDLAMKLNVAFARLKTL